MLASGRQVLFDIYRHFATPPSIYRISGITDSANTEWLGDKQKAAPRSFWEQRINGTRGEVPVWATADIRVLLFEGVAGLAAIFVVLSSSDIRGR